MWNQIYDPFGNAVISTIVAAIPAVFLLALIATGKIKIHIAAVVSLAVAVVIAICRLHDADRDGPACGRTRRAHRVLPDRMDHPQRHFPLPPHGRARLVRDHAAVDRRHHARPPPSAPADSLRVRRVLRGRVGLRNARRGDGRDPDGPRLLAACGRRSLADRQHRPCRLRGAGRRRSSASPRRPDWTHRRSAPWLVVNCRCSR